MAANGYPYAPTLLGYFKAGLTRNGCSLRYFNRAFLNAYITDYKRGDRDYSATQATDFYRKNGCAYCVFLELYADYRQAMDRLTAAGF